MKNQRHASQQGFALIVVGALFVAFAMITAAVIDRTNATKQLGLAQKTQTQLSRLSDALVRYALDHNGRYPCPAGIAVALNNASFGMQVTGCEISPINSALTALNAGVAKGMIPVTDLLIYGADPNDAFDAWGNRIVYIVDRQLTPAGLGTAYSPRQTVSDPYLTNLNYNSPDYILISYGRDGVGAIPKNATTVAIACNAGSAEDRMKNCKDELTYITRPMNTGPGITSAQYFDDLIVFYGK